MSMIHACIENSQGLNNLYNQGFEKKNTCSMGSKANPGNRWTLQHHEFATCKGHTSTWSQQKHRSNIIKMKNI